MWMHTPRSTHTRPPSAVGEACQPQGYQLQRPYETVGADPHRSAVWCAACLDGPSFLGRSHSYVFSVLKTRVSCQDGLGTILTPVLCCMLRRMLLGGRAGYITVQCRLWQRASSFACNRRADLVVLILTMCDNPAMGWRHSLLVPSRYQFAHSSVWPDDRPAYPGLVQTSAVPCEANAIPFSFQFQCRKTND